MSFVKMNAGSEAHQGLLLHGERPEELRSGESPPAPARARITRLDRAVVFLHGRRDQPVASSPGLRSLLTDRNRARVGVLISMIVREQSKGTQIPRRVPAGGDGERERQREAAIKVRLAGPRSWPVRRLPRIAPGGSRSGSCAYTHVRIWQSQ